MGVKAALSPSRTIDPSKLAFRGARRPWARVVVATGKISGRFSKVEIKSKAQRQS